MHHARLEADLEDVQGSDHEARDAAGGRAGDRIQHRAVPHAQALPVGHARLARSRAPCGGAQADAPLALTRLPGAM